MKIIRDNNNGFHFQDSNINLEKIIHYIENDKFEIALNELNLLIEREKDYSDAYVFRFLTNMYLLKFEDAAIDLLTGFWLEKNKKFINPKYFMADVVREFWYSNSSHDSRYGLKKALQNLENESSKLKIIK